MIKSGTSWEWIKINHEPIFRVLVNHSADINIQRGLEDGTSLSVLQLSATRPKTFHPSTYIADYRIRNRVPFEPLRGGARSSLAFAVLNHDFEMVDLLLSGGADINTTYQVDTGSPLAAQIAELAASHFEMNMKAIQYLFNIVSSLETNTEEVAVTTLTDQIQNMPFGNQAIGPQRVSSSHTQAL